MKISLKKSIGTKLDKRLARGDKGINPLDAACREHDIVYAKHRDSSERYKADLKLKEAAGKRVRARDASFGERAAAAAVSLAMRAKTGISRIGASLRTKMKKRMQSKQKRKTTKKSSKRKQISFKQLVKGVRININKSRPKTIDCAVRAAIRTARKLISGKRITKIPRIIKVPSISGGLLPIIPILTGLAAAGTIVNTAIGVYNAIKTIKNRGNVQAVGQQKLGAGLYLTQGKRGRGLYLRPYPKN